MWTLFSGMIVGILLGFVMQRTRFCLTGGFRDMYVQRSNKMFYALLIAITVQSMGLLLLNWTGVLKVSYDSFPLIGTMIGSFIFGMGIILAGGCATGTYYRAGEGLIGSWIALCLYAFTSAVTKFGFLKPVMEAVNSKTVYNSDMSATTGIPMWILVVILTIFTAIVVTKTMRKPKKTLPQLKQKFTGIRHVLFEKKYHTFTAAVIIGLIALLAWPMSYSAGREGGLGITTPSAKLIKFLMTGDTALIDWGVYLVIGIFVGSYIAAKGSREFKWRLPDKITIRNSAIGGVFMGFGASMAGGCSIGNGLVATATMSWQGWIGLAFIILGTWFMSYFIFVRPMQQLKAQASVSV
ncbi:YeeE/YedE family protein [Macrococcus hajekii]|uniref:YeeE/YedE family protein n=1 Tax=Macrococcus hajekii TaxID=198482 RepID=A0A4R6BMS1_9STAP|nr:YeeE/YedE family protein [Macrococcus hajekii]TDM02967.1 YeeE/YedE family protein [Macrococcus hajekii]GGB05434.1 membrane protein [Macrococcus hajekii]